VPDFVAAGYRVLSFDNRGIGKSDRPAGPYTSRMMADDTKALVDSLGISGFHLMGVSMGGMIAQEYALAYPDDVKSATFACTYGVADAFCQTMFAMWADIARKISVPLVMRDVALWAFTGPFFEERPDDAAEFAAAMAGLDQSLDAYLGQGDHIMVTRIDNYYEEGRPYLDSITFRFLPVDQSRVAALAAGELDRVDAIPL